MTENGQMTTDARVADFDFDLPPELIAQHPPAERGTSRMLVMDRATSNFRDAIFAGLTALLNPGDLLVLNESRVIPARLFARRTTIRDRQEATAEIEVLLYRAGWRKSLARAREAEKEEKVAVGERLGFHGPEGEAELEAEVLERGGIRRAADRVCARERFLRCAGSNRPHAAAALHSPRRRCL